MMNLSEHDRKERERALDPTQSFIVQAPAGSGKTELLIQRFLTLLALVNHPEEILAITFTKKAANEMRLRILKALKQAANDPEPNTTHAKKTWILAKRVLLRDKQYEWHLLDNPNQLRIQTIDSLCSYLTKQLPMLSHFGAPPDITDDSLPLYRDAVSHVLHHLEEEGEWREPIATLLMHLDNDLNKLHDLLIDLLGRRDQWLPYLKLSRQENVIRKELEHYLTLIISDHLCTLNSLFPQEHVNSVLSLVRFAGNQLALNKQESPLLACCDLLTLPGKKINDKDAWLGIATLLLSKQFTFRKRVNEEIGFSSLKNFHHPDEINTQRNMRQQFNDLLFALNHHEKLRIALTELFYLPNPVYQDKQWQILQALLKVLKLTAAELYLTFQSHGKIDFIENTQAALNALGNHEDISHLSLALDYQIQHILVDEFQDTSLTQYQLIEKLTAGWILDDGRTLFVVGDPMQSIYRFREAEVGLFIRMQKTGINQLPLIPLTLSINFRSHPAIIEWNNALFHKLFPTHNDIAKGAVSYSPSISHSQIQNANDNQKAVTLRGFVNDEGNNEAIEIAELITSLKKDFPEESIAILVRSRSHLKQLIPYLKKYNLSYRAVDIDPLASRQHIKDLLSLTCALLHPADRIAWLAILRAPWCGLTLADLLVIANYSPYAPIWEALQKQEVLQQLSRDGQKRLDYLLNILKNKMAERERLSFRYWIESTWLLLGGPATLKEEIDIEDIFSFFNLLEELASHQLLEIDKLKERIHQLYAATHHDETILQIMTIHSAKGLEFDTVILPELNRKLPNDDKALLRWMERPFGQDKNILLLAPLHASGKENDALYEYIHREQRIKSAYEIDRLLYVAKTRAKKRLYLFFNIERDNNDHSIKIESGSFLQKMWPHVEKEVLSYLEEKTSIPDELPASSTKSNHPLTRFIPDWQNPIKDLAPNHLTSHLKSSGFMLAQQKAVYIGVITHTLLQQIAENGASWWKDISIQQQTAFLQKQFKQLGLLPEDLDDAVAITQQAMVNTLSDSRGQWILKSHQRAQSELAITAIIQDKIQNVIIDRTFIDDEGICWIIDYKTSSPQHQSLQDFLQQEQTKYSAQLKNYYQAMQSMSTAHPIRLGLYFPLIPAWCEWDFSEDK